MTDIIRTNKIGLTFKLSSINSNQTKVVCVDNSKTLTLNGNFDTINQAWFAWQMKGMHVQVAFNFLSADEREFLLTAITPDEWNALFSDDE